MGNRAVIATEKKDIGIYLHWNGGRDSVEAFLKAAEDRGYISPEIDCYGWARLCQLIGNYFGGNLNIGIDRYENLDCDNGDNGVYIIKNWKIVGREFFSGTEQQTYNLSEIVIEIKLRQPKDGE